MKIAATYLLCILTIEGHAVAGAIRGQITDLFGNSRNNLGVTFALKGYDPQNGEPYEIVRNGRMTTDGRDGSFAISVPDDKYRENTKEIVLQLASQDLAPVEIRSLLGPAQHNISVVMPTRGVFEQRGLEFPLFALAGRRGSFHLLDEHGTALYRSPATSQWHMARLSFYDADADFYYYRSDDDPNQRWAFSRRPTASCCWCGRRYVVRYGGWAVWIWAKDAATSGWRVFDHVAQTVPENGYQAKPGFQRIGKQVASNINGADSIGDLGQEPSKAHFKRNPVIQNEARASQPSPPVYRSWHDSSGRFTTVACLTQIDPKNGNVLLNRLDNSKRVWIPVRSLSKDDLEYLSDLFRGSRIR